MPLSDVEATRLKHVLEVEVQRAVSRALTHHMREFFNTEELGNDLLSNLHELAARTPEIKRLFAVLNEEGVDIVTDLLNNIIGHSVIVLEKHVHTFTDKNGDYKDDSWTKETADGK